MKTYLAAVAVLLSLASPLSAQEQTPITDRTLHIAPYAFMAAGQAADVIITRRGFTNGCGEANIIAYGSLRPSTGRLVGMKALGTLPAVVTMLMLQKAGHQKAANWVGLIAGSIGFGAAGYNLTVNCGVAR